MTAIALPIPKRFVVGQLFTDPAEAMFTLDADAEVFTFVRLLAPVERVDVWPEYEKVDRAWVRLSARYAYDESAAKQCYRWIMAQLEQEYANTRPAGRSQEDVS